MSVAGNFLNKTKQLVSLAGKKTGTAVEISKLKLQTVQVNSMIQSTYERIGTLIYEQEKTGTDNYDLVAVCIKEIDALLVQLNEVNDRINGLKNGFECPVCKTINPPDMVYCQKCGANLQKQRENPQKPEHEQENEQN